MLLWEYKFDWILIVGMGALGGLPEVFIEPYDATWSLQDPDFQMQKRDSRVGLTVLMALYIGVVNAVLILMDLLLPLFGKLCIVRRIHHHLIGWCFAFALNLIAAGLISVITGGLRPSFYSYCEPVNASSWLPGESVVCGTDDLDNLDYARRGFPCGHCSLATASGLYLTIALLPYLDVWDGRSYIWKHVVTITPTLGGIFISLTRWSEGKHTLIAVGVGLLIAVVVAPLAYFTFFPSIFSRARGLPFCVRDSIGMPYDLLSQEITHSPLPPKYPPKVHGPDDHEDLSHSYQLPREQIPVNINPNIDVVDGS